MIGCELQHTWSWLAYCKSEVVKLISKIEEKSQLFERRQTE